MIRWTVGRRARTLRCPVEAANERAIAVPGRAPSEAGTTVRWAKLLDQQRCIGCHACTTACKSENDVPLGVTRTYVKSVDVGRFPATRRAFQVTRCNQCDDAPCVAACPTGAMFRRLDGIVDFDKRICIGCKACIAACPYDAIFINPEDHSAEKCNFCAHRLEVGLEPACVVVCPTGAILVGDLNDPASAVARAVGRAAVTVRRPEKHTNPKVFYRGAHEATLDPLAARRPEGGLFAWALQRGRTGGVAAGVSRPASSAEALLSYDVPHTVPWGWRVSCYTWTKGLAAGGFAVPVLLALAGRLGFQAALVRFFAPGAGLAFLALTGVLLIADLKHPWRFYLIFTKHQLRSWLVRGAFLLAAFGAGLAADLGGSLAGSVATERVAGAFGVALALAAACYTAWLFAQATARDLWQSPLLAPHLAVQAALLGAATALLAGEALGPATVRPLLAWLVCSSAAAHLALVGAEVTTAHPSAHGRLAVREMTRGSQAVAFWVGILAVAVALAAPLVGAIAAAFALGGVLAHEHAFVRAGQSVPLA
jgi:Fe-S-cluster-containing dehydrogenase component